MEVQTLESEAEDDEIPKVSNPIEIPERKTTPHPKQRQRAVEGRDTHTESSTRFREDRQEAKSLASSDLYQEKESKVIAPSDKPETSTMGESKSTRRIRSSARTAVDRTNPPSLPPQPEKITNTSSSATKALITKEIPNEFTTFSVIISGQIESCQFPGCDDLFCRYQFVHGDDWKYIAGSQEGITQYSSKSQTYSEIPTLVWNFPIEISLRSTNIFGWPQIALSVYGPDFMSRDVIRGYGAMRVPLAAGSYTKYVRLFRPVSGSVLQEWIAALTAQRTEYNDPKFVCRPEGRKVTRVVSCGAIKVQLHVVTRGMAKLGYIEN